MDGFGDWEETKRFVLIFLLSLVIQFGGWAIYLGPYLIYYLEELTNAVIQSSSGYSTFPSFDSTNYFIIAIVVLAVLVLAIGLKIGYNSKKDLVAAILGQLVVNFALIYIVDITTSANTLFIIEASIIMLLMGILFYFLGVLLKNRPEQY
ncbi:hypothetical protein [Saccharolobus islandicus]|uniref:Uncharacterized protein n=1 Tax=Saccharolobus islandicus (strain M.16.27) TaxID=427318 RepID=C3N623_SACI3|nr:hypothetical protein [Sulfolobus islandicus]ACP55448.1 hypothetical protein M1627_1566 [Sulfolobus islandicus M.16.27]